MHIVCTSVYRVWLEPSGVYLETFGSAIRREHVGSFYMLIYSIWMSLCSLHSSLTYNVVSFDKDKGEKKKSFSKDDIS